MYKKVKLETSKGSMYVSQPVNGTYYLEIKNDTIRVPAADLMKALIMANDDEPYPYKHAKKE